MFPKLDVLCQNVFGHFYDSAVKLDMLHQLAWSLESALAHTKAAVSLCGFFVGLAVSFLCYLLLRLLSPLSLARRSPARIAYARKILQALLTIITPTQSVWPRQYVNLAYRAAAVRESPVCLPLETLYEDVVKQRIELRNPRIHLPLLFRGALATAMDSSLSFMLSVGGDYTDRRRRSAVSNTYCAPAIGQQGTSTVLGPGSAPCCSLFLHVLHQDMPTASLDCVHPEQLSAHLEHLKATLAPDAFLMLGLTTIASTATQYQVRLASLPFLPRKATLCPPGPQRKPIQRSTTPLRTSVTQVIDMLKSGRTPVRVEIVQNVSREYAEFMHEYLDGLEQDAEVRAQFVREWGMEAWVEERLCTVWEAALVEVGLLEAWTIIVRKSE